MCHYYSTYIHYVCHDIKLNQKPVVKKNTTGYKTFINMSCYKGLYRLLKELKVFSPFVDRKCRINFYVYSARALEELLTKMNKLEVGYMFDGKQLISSLDNVLKHPLKYHTTFATTNCISINEPFGGLILALGLSDRRTPYLTLARWLGAKERRPSDKLYLVDGVYYEIISFNQR